MNGVDPSGLCAPGINCPPGLDDEDQSKEGGFNKDGGSPGGIIGEVNRGNLRPCPGTYGEGERGIAEKIKDEVGGIRGNEDILCDDEGNVYVQHKRFDKKLGRWVNGQLEPLGKLQDYQEWLSSTGGGFPVPGDIGEVYNSELGAYTIVMIGATAYILWYYDNVELAY